MVLLTCYLLCGIPLPQLTREMLRSGAFESQGVSLPSSILGDAGGPASMEAAMQRVMEQMRGGRPSGAPQGAARGSEIPVSRLGSGQRQEDAASSAQGTMC
jgi:hypothetical protein